MPLWSSRQWHVLSAGRPVASALLRPRRALFAACTQNSYASQRRYAARSSPARTYRRIIIPDSIAGTQPDHLVEHIEPLSDVSVERRLIIFLTPAFAPWLNHDDGFLEKAVRRFFAAHIDPSGSPNARVSAIVAVVDKLPTPQNIQGPVSLEQAGPQGMHMPPVFEHGHEGLAYAALPLRDASFTIRTDLAEKAWIDIGPLGRSQERASFGHVIRVPLANTVFQTGTPMTMTTTVWEKSSRSPKFVLVFKKDIVNLDLTLGSNASSPQSSELAIPLLPLTMPRQVDAAMGNIIRRVMGPDGKSKTASEELEKAVPRYFESRNEPSQAVAVWALVIPREGISSISQATEHLLDKATHTNADAHNGSWHHLWKADPPQMNDQVRSALSQGARLHRVLSGGGGWGKKAGLLSLDPSAAADESSASRSADFPDFSDLSQPGEDLSTALQQIVQEGEYIQFYTSPPVRQKRWERDDFTNADTLELLSERTTPWSFEIGTLPSSADALEADSWQHRASSLNRVVVFKDAFGALSEGGMTFRHRTDPNAGRASAARPVTKVDVPFSRFFNAISEPDVVAGEEDRMSRVSGGDDSGIGTTLHGMSDEENSGALAPSAAILASVQEDTRHDMKAKTQKPVTVSNHEGNHGPRDAQASEVAGKHVGVRKYVDVIREEAPDDRRHTKHLFHEPSGPHAAAIRARVEAVLTERDSRRMGLPRSKIRRLLSMPPTTFHEMHLHKSKYQPSTTRQATIKKGVEEIKERMEELGHKLENQKWEDEEVKRWIRPGATTALQRQEKEDKKPRKRKVPDSKISTKTQHPFSRTDIVIDSISYQVSRIEAKVSELGSELYADLIWNSVGLVKLQVEQLRDEPSTIEGAGALAARVNQSAAEVHVMHTQLRSSLGGMILDEADRPSPAMTTERFNSLITKLHQLRSFEDNLFSPGDASRDLNVKKRLHDLELRDPDMHLLQDLDQFLRTLHVRRTDATADADADADAAPRSLIRKMSAFSTPTKAARWADIALRRQTEGNRQTEGEGPTSFHPDADVPKARDRPEGVNFEHMEVPLKNRPRRGLERSRWRAITGAPVVPKSTLPLVQLHASKSHAEGVETGREKRERSGPPVLSPASHIAARKRKPVERADLLEQVKGWLG